jgi:hypothetical protein
MSRPPSGAVTFTADQVNALVMQRQLAIGNTTAVPMPRPAQWSTDPFGPGTPLRPAPINIPRPDTGRAAPRLFEYPVATNLQIDSRVHVPWKILQEAADLPLFRKCIKRRKGVCHEDFVVVVDPKAVAREASATGEAKTDIESALRKKYTPEISRITDWFQTPDRKNGLDWQQWTSMLMENRLKYDATVIYPRRTYGGDLFALECCDGKLFKPLLDEYGGRPLPPNPFVQQILYGFPRGEYVADAEIDADGRTIIPGGYHADQLYYERTEFRPETPYGMSDTEIALLDGMLWMRRMGWLMAEYTEGVMPGSVIETDNAVDWDVKQWEDWLRAINDHLGGNTAERQKFKLFPPGTHPVQIPEVAERYKPDMDMFLIKLVAGDFGLNATELGFPEVGSLGASFHEGEEDVLFRVTKRPDMQWLSSLATKMAIRQLGMPPILQISILGLESEDEAAADAVALSQIQSGRMTLNEDRARRGEPAYNFAEADMPQLQVGRGVVFLEGASAQGPPGTTIGPAMAAPPGAPALPPAAGEPAPPAVAGPEDGASKSEPESPPGTAALEVAAYRRWVRKGRQRGTFTCQVITKAAAPATAPDMAADGAVVFKDADAGPKAGLAGSGTRRS